MGNRSRIGLKMASSKTTSGAVGGHMVRAGGVNVAARGLKFGVNVGVRDCVEVWVGLGVGEMRGVGVSVGVSVSVTVGVPTVAKSVILA